MSKIIVILPEIMIFILLCQKGISFDEFCTEIIRAFSSYLLLVLFFVLFNLIMEDNNSFLIFLFNISLEEFIKILFFSLFNEKRLYPGSIIIFGTAFTLFENFFISYTSYQMVIARMFGFFAHSVFLLIYVEFHLFLKNKGVQYILFPAALLGIVIHLLYDFTIEYINNVVVFSFVNVILFEFFRNSWKKVKSSID